MGYYSKQAYGINHVKYLGSQILLDAWYSKKVYLDIYYIYMYIYIYIYTHTHIYLAFINMLSGLKKGQVIARWCVQRRQYDTGTSLNFTSHDFSQSINGCQIQWNNCWILCPTAILFSLWPNQMEIVIHPLAYWYFVFNPLQVCCATTNSKHTSLHCEWRFKSKNLFFRLPNAVTDFTSQ